MLASRAWGVPCVAAALAITSPALAVDVGPTPIDFLDYFGPSSPASDAALWEQRNDLGTGPTVDTSKPSPDISPSAGKGASGKGFRFTEVFTQFQFYDTDSDRPQLRYRYRSYGFTAGANFRIGRDWYGLMYAGYAHATDRISSPPPQRGTNFNIGRIGGQLRYRVGLGLFAGVDLSIRPFGGDIVIPASGGGRNGWAINGGPFLSYTMNIAQFFFTVKPRFDFAYTSTSSTGTRGNIGGKVSFTMAMSANWRINPGAVVGIGVTPGWVLAERSAVSPRANGPFHLTLSAGARVRVAPKFWVYGQYGYRFHKTNRSAQYAILGVSYYLQ